MSFTIFQNEKTSFQAIKTRTSKSRKIDIFPNPWFWSNNGHFSNFFFQAIQARRTSFTKFYNVKTPFQAIKTRSSKSRRIDIFPKGLTYGFGPNWHFFNFFLGNIGQENVFSDILEWKNHFLGYKNKKLKKQKNVHFSKGVNLWFWSKNGHFSNFFFLGNIRQENVFYDILERKVAFLGYKNKKLEKSKNSHFA